MKRQEGFGILRVVANFSWIIGPTIGGFWQPEFLPLVRDGFGHQLSRGSHYLSCDPGNQTRAASTRKRQSFLKTLAGYRFVFRDTAFVSFITANIIMLLVYQQMYSSLSVYLRDNHGINPQGYGFLMTTSAITVVLFQFWLTSIIKHLPTFPDDGIWDDLLHDRLRPLRVVTTFILFALNIVIITIGEMIIMPTSQALVAGFAPARNARTLYGNCRTLVGDPLDDRPRRGRLYSG